MSYSFYAPTDSAPDLGLLGLREGLLCEELEQLEGPMHEGQVLHVYLDGISVRSVELAWEDHSFQARIMSMACHEDHALAIDLACEVAREAGTQVRSEEDVAFDPAAMDHPYGEDWIRQQVESVVRTTLILIREHNEIVMSGANSTVVLTRAVADRVVAGANTPAEQAEALFGLFRAVSFPGEDWYRAAVMSVTLQSGATHTVVVWGPGVAYQFAKADAVMLMTEPQVSVPWSALSELAGSGLTEVDGATVRVLAVSEDEWPELLRRAESFVTPLEELGSEPQASAVNDVPDSTSETTSMSPVVLALLGTGLMAAVIIVWAFSS